VVRVGLADRDVVRLRADDVALVGFDAWPGQIFAGQVGNIAAAADPATGTFTVEVPVAAGSARFVQGLVAKVAFSPRDAARVPVVPLQSLIEANGEQAGVFVLDADASGQSHTVRRVTIRIGRMIGDEIEVRDGITPGMRVVIDGAAFLENGEAVRVEAQS
jgi:RND family efflux transporter MFP subunit